MSEVSGFRAGLPADAVAVAPRKVGLFGVFTEVVAYMSLYCGRAMVWLNEIRAMILSVTFIAMSRLGSRFE